MKAAVTVASLGFWMVVGLVGLRVDLMVSSSADTRAVNWVVHLVC